MNDNDMFGQRLSDWLSQDANHRVPDHLDVVLVHTAATRQRPWWSSPERWLPMTTTTRGRLAVAPAAIWVALALLLVLAIAGTAVLTGVIRPSAPTLVPATNGRIFVADGGTLRSFAADGTDPQDVRQLTGATTLLAMSPDGTRLAYLEELNPFRIRIIAIDGASDDITVHMPEGVRAGDQISWSPDGTQIAFPAFKGSEEFVYVAPTDGGEAAPIGVGSIDPDLGIWWPSWSPTGEWLSFVGVDKTTNVRKIYVTRPDGRDLRELETAAMSSPSGEDLDPGSPTWSPDPTVQRLVYTSGAATLGVNVIDVTTGDDYSLGAGFWPTWSPSGDRISYWTDATVVVSTADVLAGLPRPVHVFPGLSGSGCSDNLDLADKAFCGPATWSPDGTQLLAMDIARESVLSLPADGNGDSMVIPLGPPTTTLPREGVAWQPNRP